MWFFGKKQLMSGVCVERVVSMDAETFAFWRDERLDLATSAALADVDGDGVHLMPVTEEGYAGVARLADTIQALASARSS